MILGPDDPRAITDPDELAALREYTKGWHELLGIKPMTAKQRKDYEAQLKAVLDFIGKEKP